MYGTVDHNTESGLL